MSTATTTKPVTSKVSATTKKHATVVRSFPWGGELYLEIPLSRKSANKFYARHGSTSEGRQFIEFSKFGPVPNVEGETYSQKLRLFSAVQWAQLKHYVEGELAKSIGWDMPKAQQDFAELLAKARAAQNKKAPVAATK